MARRAEVVARALDMRRADHLGSKHAAVEAQPACCVWAANPGAQQNGQINQ
jgi:hypothetical protein